MSRHKSSQQCSGHSPHGTNEDPRARDARATRIRFCVASSIGRAASVLVDAFPKLPERFGLLPDAAIAHGVDQGE